MKPAVFLVALIFSFTVSADFPRLIAYQGVLTDTAGNPEPDGSRQVAFSLYETETGGSALWSETQTLTVRQGLFAALLGNVTALDIPFDKQYWLGVKVGTAAELAPRMRLAAGAYALHSAVADSAVTAKLAYDCERAEMADSAKKVRGLEDMLAAKAVAGHEHSWLTRVGDTAKAVVVDTAGSVGIGISSPLYTVHVKNPEGNHAKLALEGPEGMEGQLHFRSNGESRWIVFSDESDARKMKVYKSKSPVATYLTIDTTGRLGIGTTTPQYALDVNGNIKAYGLITEREGRSFKFINSTDGNSYLNFEGGAGGSRLGFQIDGGSVMSITQSGNVGIGTTSPTERLHIYSNVTGQSERLKIESSDYAGIHLRGDRGNSSVEPGGAYITFDLDANQDRHFVGKLQVAGNDPLGRPYENTLENAMLIGGTANHPLQFGTNSNVNMTILTTGNVGIGTTTPQYALDVNGVIKGSNVSTDSDLRLKTNITPLDSALSMVSALTGVSYDWNRASYPDRNFPDTRQIGLVAQEVEGVLPELVHTDSEGYKSLSYDKLTAVLVQAVKELRGENEALRKENGDLRADVVAIKERLGI